MRQWVVSSDRASVSHVLLQGGADGLLPADRLRRRRLGIAKRAGLVGPDFRPIAGAVTVPA